MGAFDLAGVRAGDGARFDIADVLIVLGLVVVVPLGLGLLTAPGVELLRRVWPVGAVCGALSLALPIGLPAAGLASVYAAVSAGAGVCALAALASLARQRTITAPRIATVTALGCLPISGIALIADTLDASLLGYTAEIITLTVAHFVFAGFAASTLSAQTALWLRSRVADAACYGAILSPAVVGATFALGPRVQLLGVVPLTVSLVVLAVLTLAAKEAGAGGVALLLRRISALSVVAPMLLALHWTLGLAADLPHLSIEQMKVSHGLLNAVGYALCGVIGWRLNNDSPHPPEEVRRIAPHQ